MRGLQVFQLLKPRIGEREAGALVTYIDKTLKEDRMELIEVMQKTFATKEDLLGVRGELKEEISSLRGELKEDIAGLRGELKEGIAGLRGELKEGITGLRGELKEGIAGLKGELKADIASLKGGLEVKISDVRTDIMRWMFAFLVTMLLAILGLYFKK